jgi:hypothetical protein
MTAVPTGRSPSDVEQRAEPSVTDTWPTAAPVPTEHEASTCHGELAVVENGLGRQSTDGNRLPNQCTSVPLVDELHPSHWPGP